jgi:hypothetical protein
MRPTLACDPSKIILRIEDFDWTYLPQSATISVTQFDVLQRPNVRSPNVVSEVPMSPKYDLFERFPDGSSLWRACVGSLEGARLHVQHLSLKSPNQFYAMHIGTGKTVLLQRQAGEMLSSLSWHKQSKAAAA